MKTFGRKGKKGLEFAAEVMGWTQKSQAIKALITLLEGQDGEVRLMAARTLTESRDPKAIKALLGTGLLAG